VSKVVLDASALLALVNQEPGQAVVAEWLPRSLVSAVNASELTTAVESQRQILQNWLHNYCL
jgi:PIN domain nuclease of toxin-antitoxin system